MYYTYVIYSEKILKYYVGYTSDLKKRISHHNLGLDRWTKRGTPWKLVYKEEYRNKHDAFLREKYLKTGKGREFFRAEVAQVVTARV